MGFAEWGFAELGFAELGFAELGFAKLSFAELGFADMCRKFSKASFQLNHFQNYPNALLTP